MSANNTWQQWAKHDPYYAVLTADRFHACVIEKARAEFFATGESHVAWLMRMLDLCPEQHRQMSVLDHGCGVGRLTIPLAKRFAIVTAGDVASDMLTETRQNCAAFGVSNVTTLLFQDPADFPVAAFSLTHSLYVLQHLPLQAGLKAIGALARSLEPDGILVLHITTKRNFSPLKELVYRIGTILNGAKISRYLPGRLGKMMMLGTEYDLPAVICELTRAGCGNYRILTADPGPISSVILSCRRTAYSGDHCPTFPEQA